MSSFHDAGRLGKAEEYNSNTYGNMNVHGWDYDMGDGETMAFHLSATPTGDELFEAYLSHLEAKFTDKNGNYFGPIHLQVNLQKMHGSEGKRSNKLHAMARRHPALRVMTVPMDGHAWHMKGRFSETHTIKQFCDEYKAYSKTADSGFSIDDCGLTERERSGAFDAVARAFGEDKTMTGDTYEGGTRPSNVCSSLSHTKSDEKSN